MTVKCYRTNTDFDILHFVSNQARTADGKYVLFVSQRNLLLENLRNFEAQMLRKEARIKETEYRLEAQKLLKQRNEIQELLLQADLLELHASDENMKLNYEGAKKEIAFIEECMAQLKLHCSYADEDFFYQQEKVQRIEWKLELLERARNYVALTGTIPVDHFVAMKSHPDFNEEISPLVGKYLTMANAENYKALTSELLVQNKNILLK